MSIYTGVDNTVKTINKLYTGRASVVRPLSVLYGVVDGVVKELNTEYLKENIVGLRLYFTNGWYATYDPSTSSWSSNNIRYSIDEILNYTITASGSQYTITQNSDNSSVGYNLLCYLELADGSLVLTGANSVIADSTKKNLSLFVQMYFVNLTSGGTGSYTCNYLSAYSTYSSFFSGSLSPSTWHSGSASSIYSNIITNTSTYNDGNVRIGRSGYNGRRGQNIFNFYSATWDGKSIPVTVYTTKAPS